MRVQTANTSSFVNSSNDRLIIKSIYQVIIFSHCPFDPDRSSEDAAGPSDADAENPYRLHETREANLNWEVMS